MKILLSAIACYPDRGSESGVGWKAATALSSKHTVHVLTSKGEQEGVELALATGACPNLSFTFFGSDAPYHENRLIARLQSWKRYLDWTRQSLEIARMLVAQQRFDLAHHVTYSSWRIASPLWQLDLPFVWGPVGGTAEYPNRLLGKLAPRSQLFELMRGVSNRHASRSKSLKECARNSDAVVASNKETFDKLLPLRGRKEGLHVLFPAFFTDHQVELLKFDAANKPPDKPLRLFAGGNIIGSKGVIFALEALQVASREGIAWQLVVGGYGPEIPFLRKKAQALGIADRIDFHKGFDGNAYRQKLKDSHIFVLPSFRENAPGTILEAMLAGCVPVVVDASAQGDIVEKQFGFKVPVTSATKITADIADALIELARNPNLRIGMGQMASDFVARNYREDAYVKGIEAIYDEVLQTRANRISRRHLDGMRNR
jgi:glycosyltransferase involved in cell wall biosynthesis